MVCIFKNHQKRIFITYKAPIEARQRVKNRVAANLVNWIQAEPGLFEGRDKELLEVLNTKATQGLSDEQLEFVLDLINKKRVEVAKKVQEYVRQFRPKAQGGKRKWSLINSENLDRTLNEALYDLRFIDDAKRDQAMYIGPRQLEALIEAQVVGSFWTRLILELTTSRYQKVWARKPAKPQDAL